MERGGYNRALTGPSPYIKVSRAICSDDQVQSIRWVPTCALTQQRYLCRVKECRGSKQLATADRQQLPKPRKQAFCPIEYEPCMYS